MDPRFARLDALFQAARRLPPAERRAFLEAEAPDDAPLRAEVADLLATLDSAPAVEPTPAIAGLVQGVLREAEAGLPDGFGEFRIVRRIASGGMGVVYEAEQSNPRRRVALKVLHPGAASEEGRKRFGREAEILARLHHPGIAQVHVFGSAPTAAGDSPFLAMELIHGVPLNVYARDLDMRRRLELLAKVCDAVAHAHANGVIHRDLKPSNILVTAEGEPKVLDFGVARLIDADTALRTRTGQVIGTLAYMSPEQATGDLEHVDTRSDVYALGVLGYEMLCGRLPHEIGSGALADAIRRIVEEEPPAPSSLDRSLRGDVSLILRKALAKEPARRYDGAAALAEDIRRHLHDEPILARPPTTTYQIRKFVRRHRALVGGVAATIAALVVGLVLAVRAAREEERQRLRADRSAADARWATSKALMEAAASDLRTSAGHAARGRLERIAPEHRGWEWRYLSAQNDASSRLVPLDLSRLRMITFDRGGESVGFIDERGPALADARSGVRGGPECPKLRWQRICRLGGVPVAVGNDGRRVGWTRLDTGTTTYAQLGPTISAAAGTEGGSTIALCQHGGVGYSWIHLHDAVSGEHIRSVRGDAVEMMSVAFSPDGKYLAAAGFYLDTHIIEVATKAEVRVLHGHSGGVRALAYSPDGRLLLSGSADKTAVLWRVEDGAVLQRWSAHEGEVIAVAWSRDGSRVAYGDTLGTIRLWNVATGVCEHALQGHTQWVGAIAFRDERTLVSAGPDGVREWDVTPGRDPNVLRYHAGRAEGNAFSYVYAVAFSPDGSLLASGAWDMTVRLVDPATNELLATLRLPDRVEDVGFSPDARNLLVTTSGGACQTWSADTGERLAELQPVKPPRAPNPARSPDGRLVASVMENGRCIVRTHPEGAVVREIEAHRGPATAVGFDASGTRLATGGADRIVRVWELESGRMLLELQGHRDKVYAFAFHPDGKLLASGANDNTIRLWDLERGVERLDLSGHENYVHGLAFSPDGQTLVSASGDNTVRIWTTLTMRERQARADAEMAARAAVAPKVEALFAQLRDARAVAAAIRDDASLGDDRRRAALHLVLLRSGASR
jgi:eukaryotic-like serine/threonine-protein kinase